VHLDQVFDAATGTIERVVDMLDRSFDKRGDDIADVHAHRSGFDPGGNAALARPGYRAVTGFCIVVQD
jgi:hypothetical protein